MALVWPLTPPRVAATEFSHHEKMAYLPVPALLGAPPSWPSPQSSRGWPPAVLDHQPYSVTMHTATELVLKSRHLPANAFTGVQSVMFMPSRAIAGVEYTTHQPQPGCLAAWRPARLPRVGRCGKSCFPGNLTRDCELNFWQLSHDGAALLVAGIYGWTATRREDQKRAANG